MRLWLLIVSSLLFIASARGAEGQPNFVVLFVDDLGWSDVGCYGNDFHKSPNIDAMATRGMRFTNAYAAASICSPTRASVMTGKSPARVHITDWIPGARGPRNARLETPQDLHALPAEETTIAEALREGGYETWYGGKWHLGGEGSMPTDHGFDTYVNETGGDEAWPPSGDGKKPALRTSTRDLTDAAIEHLQTRDADKPLLLFVSYRDVHTPIQAIADTIDRYPEGAAPSGTTPTEREGPGGEGETRLRHDDRQYASMVTAVDDSVGRIVAAVNDLGLGDNTYILFLSDNGGLSTRGKPGPTTNEPLRAGKGWLYEGGIRIPWIVTGPGVSAGRESDVPIITTDLYPTLLALAGLPAKPEQAVDGLSLAGLLTGTTSTLDRTTLAWHYPHYHGSQWQPGSAIRVGDWKLVRFSDPQIEPQLFNLASDPGESTDLATDQPERVRELNDALDAWLDDAGAQRATPRVDPDR